MRQPLRRWVPLVVGLAGCAVFAWGLYHLLLLDSCGSDATPCPPGTGKYVAAVSVGLPVAIISTVLGGGGITFIVTFLAVGVSSILAALSGDATEPGQETFLWIFGGIFLLVGLVPFLLIPVARRKARRMAALVEHGTEAVGTVVEVRDTNVTINNNPRVALRFRIEPLSGTVEPFEASKTVTVSRVAFPRVGDRYPVWFDPEDPDQWAYGTDIGDSKSAAPPAPAPAVPAAPDNPFEKIAKLNELRMAGAITDEEFTAKKDELLKAIV